MDIWGVQLGGAWSFKMESSDHTPEMIDEAAINRETGWLRSINDAIQQVGWPWNEMRPYFVHPDFGEEVFRIKKARDKVRHYGGQNTLIWASACGVKITPEPAKSRDGVVSVANINGQEAAVKGHAVSFKQSQKVKHSSKPDWGLGLVTEDSNTHSVKVRFEQGGERVIALPTVYLQVVADNS